MFGFLRVICHVALMVLARSIWHLINPSKVVLCGAGMVEAPKPIVHLYKIDGTRMLDSRLIADEFDTI